MAKEIKKNDLAQMLGISRPTLDKYLNEGFPTKIIKNAQINDYDLGLEEDKEYKKILIKNKINMLEYQIDKLKEKLKELEQE